MAINERVITGTTEAAAADGGGTGNQEEGLILHLDANDVDSYDGDGSVWYDITNHEYTPAVNPEEHFNTVTYNSNSRAVTDITGVGFKPDLVWIKDRDTNGEGHVLVDSVRGISAGYLRSEATNAQYNTYTDSVTAFIDDGFTVGADTVGKTNYTGRGPYVAWCFKAGGAPTASKPFMVDGTGYATMSAAGFTDGTEALDSLSVNTKLGFSIAKWSGTTALTGDTVAHGLGQPPELIIHKSTSLARDWNVYSTGAGLSQNLHLNLDHDARTNEYWTVNANTHSIHDTSTSGDWVAYSFISKRGISKVGSYTGTGASGNKVYTGFEPAWVMIKNATTSGYNWNIMDNQRSDGDYLLAANTSATEVTDETPITFNRDGFTIDITSNYINKSGDTFIYLAFAKNTKETELIPQKSDFTEGTVTSGAEAEYKANAESSQAVNDQIGSVDGTLVGNAAWVNDGSSDYWSFDGAGDRITFSSNPLDAATSATIEAWVYFTTLEDNVDPYIVQCGNGTTTGLTFALAKRSNNDSSGPNKFYVYDGAGAALLSTVTAEAGRWYHFVATNDGSTITMYIDGESQGKYYSADTLNLDDHFAIGAYNNGSSYPSANELKGRVAQVRLYDSVLTSSEIKANYDATYGLYQHADLELHLDAGDTDSYDPSSDGSTWSDISGNNRDATLTSMTASNHDKEIGGWFDVVKTSDYVTIPYNAALVPTSTGYTFEGWYNFDEQVGGSHWSSLFGNWDTSGNADGMLLRFKGANVEFFVYENGSSVFSSSGTASGISTNEWFHIAMTMTTNASGGAVKVYVNGEQKISGTLSGAYNPNSTQDLFMCYGGDIDTDSARYFDGKVGQGRIYSTALTESQIRQNYNFTKNDYPNGYNGTISGATFLPSAVSFDFDGSNDYVSLDSSFRKAFDKPYRSMTMWVKWDGKSTGYGMPFYMTGAGLTNGRFACQLTHSNGELTVFVGANLNYPTTTLSSDTWYHIAIVQSGTSYEAFVDNTSIGTATNDNYTATGTATSYIGSFKNTNYYWSGEISDVKFFDKALTSAELTTDYNKGYNGAN